MKNATSGHVTWTIESEKISCDHAYINEQNPVTCIQLHCIFSSRLEIPQADYGAYWNDVISCNSCHIHGKRLAPRFGPDKIFCPE